MNVKRLPVIPPMTCGPVAKFHDDAPTIMYATDVPAGMLMESTLCTVAGR